MTPNQSTTDGRTRQARSFRALSAQRSEHLHPAVVIGVGLALLLSMAVVANADWNTGVGGTSARYSYAPVEGPGTELIRWEGSRPGIVAQQGVVDGDILVVNRIQSFTIPTGTWIVAHDITNGDELWAVQLPYDFPGTSWRSRVSAFRDGQVYASRSGNTNADYLYALDPADGSIVWQSEDLIDEGSTESLAFAPNGDLIAGNFTSLLRIDHVDGTTVWEEPRSCPTSGGCQASVFGDRVYVWEPSGSGPKVTTFDLATGARLYSSAAISPGIIQQVGLMVGPDGTIYAPRTQNNPSTDFLVALEDDGAAFTEKWRVPLGYTPFASFGVGPDGSVYSYSRQNEVLRLDPDTGDVLDQSIPLPFDITFSARMAIDAEGRVYVTNGGFDTGAFLVFHPDLQIIWSTPIRNVNVGGPVLADDGTLVICGIGTDVRAYYTGGGVNVATAFEGLGPSWLGANVPNPFRASTQIPFELAESATVTVEVFDVGGRRVRRIVSGQVFGAGGHAVAWDGRTDGGRAAPAGVYHYVLRAGGRRDSRRMVIAR